MIFDDYNFMKTTSDLNQIIESLENIWIENDPQFLIVMNNDITYHLFYLGFPCPSNFHKSQLSDFIR